MNGGNRTRPARRRTHMRRGLAVSVLLVIGLLAGACGEGDDVSSLPLLPGGTGGDRAASGAPRQESAALSADASAGVSMIAPEQPIEYRLGERVPELGGNGPAYRLEADVDEAGVTKMARA